MRLLYLLLLCAVSQLAYAQPPQSISYQGIAYNNSGAIIANSTFTVLVSIIPGSATGPAYFEETHSVSTNAQGIYSISIGSGSQMSTPTFSSIKWHEQNMFLKITIYPWTTNATSSVAQLWSVPYALFSKTSGSVTGYSVYDNINILRLNAGQTDGDVALLKGYHSSGDNGGGIFIWKTGPVFSSQPTPGYYSVDNGGTVIKSYSSDSGRWVRQYSGYTSLAYFGITGSYEDATLGLQSAIDFCKKVSLGSPDYVSHFSSSTVFIPNGVYLLDNIILKDGVSLVGENIEQTVIWPSQNAASPYLFSLDSGIVRTNVSNLNIQGNYSGLSSPSQKTVFYLQGQPGEFGSGGLHNSTFKNIKIGYFRGNGIHLAGGITTFTTSHFNNVFENVRVSKGSLNDFKIALIIEGLNSKLSFINCQFDGGTPGTTNMSNWHNVQIKGYLNNGQFLNPSGINFLNSTFQNSDYGIHIDFADNVTIDNCWFEDLGVGITVLGDTFVSKGINITNNRFANVAGYGATTPGGGGVVKDNGTCITVRNAFVNVFGNHSLAGGSICSSCSFMYIFENNVGGVNQWGNSSPDAALVKSGNTTQGGYISGNTLSCRQAKEIIVQGAGSQIYIISSDINTGEVLSIKATTNISFYITGNISFPGTTNSVLNLAAGDTAEFIKTDGNNYQLISVRH
ncbi:right-handed parallel beta-helix repeat-containing protein [Flavobacterium microcysteis]|uniref:Uncharacterized protein n=1 Tax=Flavobacterium microcysteis TaxID=2596891 RepID=A0A501QER7_9FLAO|nr:glycosyl hydrolase family 28-related protein [Flavobacterium microcysteis]TPD71103.1 hypothetical protein FJA49_04170 [Flavobacterium microcysteis]